MIKLQWESDHPIPDQDARNRLFRMMDHGLLTDMALSSEKRIYPCHKIVVAKASNYVHAAMQMQETTTGDSKLLIIAVGNFENEQMLHLLEYIYLGSLIVNSKDFYSLCKLANKLLVTLHVDQHYKPKNSTLLQLPANISNQADDAKLNDETQKNKDTLLREEMKVRSVSPLAKQPEAVKTLTKVTTEVIKKRGRPRKNLDKPNENIDDRNEEIKKSTEVKEPKCIKNGEPLKNSVRPEHPEMKEIKKPRKNDPISKTNCEKSKVLLDKSKKPKEDKIEAKQLQCNTEKQPGESKQQEKSKKANNVSPVNEVMMPVQNHQEKDENLGIVETPRKKPKKRSKKKVLDMGEINVQTEKKISKPIKTVVKVVDKINENIIEAGNIIGKDPKAEVTKPKKVRGPYKKKVKPSEIVPGAVVTQDGNGNSPNPIVKTVKRVKKRASSADDWGISTKTAPRRNPAKKLKVTVPLSSVPQGESEEIENKKTDVYELNADEQALIVIRPKRRAYFNAAKTIADNIAALNEKNSRYQTPATADVDLQLD